MNLLHHLRNWRNPAGETRLYLAADIRRRGFRVGEYSYGRPKVRFAETGAPLVIGRYCSIADRVEIFLGGNHRTSWITTYPFDNLPGLWPARPSPERSHVTRGGVAIGNDVWIGSGAVILSGVTVGDGAVIGAHAVVSRDIAPYAVVAGNPAQEMRRRFDSDTVAALVETAWWELPRADVETLIPLLQSERTAELIAAVRAIRARGPHSAG
ncbi:MAG TPA: CatB-related O-acetyltransferase [Beijerinckiaceae bacterium]